MRLIVNPNPCSSCPYRQDAPSGLWAEAEYEKLRGYDDPQTAVATFLCHQTNATGEETVCRGWLSVHRESAASRLAEIRGEVTAEERYAACSVPLHATGAAAADAGLADQEMPGSRAQRMARKLVDKGAGR